MDKSDKEVVPPGGSPPEAESFERIRRLERELYGREESTTIHDRTEELQGLGLRHSTVPVGEATHEPVAFKDMSTELSRRRRRILVWSITGGLLLIIFAGSVAATLWYRVRQNVTAEQMLIAITAAKEFTSGEEISYEVTYGNDSFVDWQNVEVIFEAPLGFTVIDTPPELRQAGSQFLFTVGDLRSNHSDSFTLRGRLVAEENASVVSRAEIRLTPVNFPSGKFDKSVLATTTVVAQPVDVSISITPQAGSGERILATVTVTNKSATALANGYLKLEPAPGIDLAVTDPSFTTGLDTTRLEWALPPLEPLASESYKVVLFVSGQPGEQRTLSVKVGVRQGANQFVQRTGSAVVTVSAAELSVTQEYEAAASPLVVRTAQSIEGVIKYRNSGTIGLKDVIVTALLEGEALDVASLKLKSGAYNPTTHTITWTSASVPELVLLNPQAVGEIRYEFLINKSETFPTDETGVNNNIVITAAIDSPDVRVPVGQDRTPVKDRFVMSVASDALLEVDAFYDDGRLGLTSSGPLPPEAGATTSYTVRVRVGSTLNDLGDVRVTGVLEEGVTYVDKTIVPVGEVSFNERTKEVVWTIPKVSAGTGRSGPFVDFHFQIAITPGENQRGDEVPFLSRLAVTGTDLFTDTALDALVARLPTTSSAASGKGRVQ